ncbi:MAG: universal stress protein, partial [Gammaproteobacteria bacterium]|nr:universal stress protein [Gammaproteobacteria bacterium]
HVCVGNPASEIHRLSEAEGVDLVVMGTHGRHGLGLLLGSTANAVLHGVKCDVLAVRIGDMEE